MKTISSRQKHILQQRIKSITSKFLLVASGCFLLTYAHGQADKRLELADQYFNAGEYYTAAGLYGQFLHPVEKSKGRSDFPLLAKKNTDGLMGSYGSKTDILFKQAESYRLANYWTDASALYKQCFDNDSLKYASALYWYAVSQRSVGNYTLAEETLNRFLNHFASATSLKQSAEKEKQILHFIKTQMAKPDTVLYDLQKINAAFDHASGFFAPATVQSNLVFTSTQFDSVATGMNPYHNRLFQTTLIDGSLQAKESVSIEGLDGSLNQGTPGISANGNYLYFTQWKIENGKTVSAIYYSKKSSGGWSKPVLLTSIIQKAQNSKQPFCSADGKYLFFASDRAGGAGNFDIWYASLKEDGTTGEPVNAGAAINSPDNEQAPFYHVATNTLVFSSDRMPGMGGYDLFLSKASGAEWKTPENLGYPINSSRDDIYFFASEKSGLLSNALFSSDRGSDCCFPTYRVTKTPKTKMMRGRVADCNTNEPLADAEVVLRNADGKITKTTTAADGTYSFVFSEDAAQHQVFVTKEKYEDKTADVAIESINEMNWRTDTLYNTALCLEKKFVLRIENVVTVYFDFDKSLLGDRAVQQLDSIFTVLTENPSYTLQVSGYTDGKGSVEYNKKLSDRRAKACADYLIQKGIDSVRISFESFGACCPVEMELINGRDNEEGRSKNRRALININKGDE